MSESASTTETELAVLSNSLEDLPTNMRMFSLAMRSLYSDNALKSGESTRKIKDIRDGVRKDAMVYVKGILPVSTDVVRSIKDFFEYYEELEYDEWEENLLDILEEVRGYKQCCTEVVKLHEKIIVPLKEKQDRAKECLSELTLLTQQFEEKKKKYEKSASSKQGWALALAFVPGVNLIACPMLASSSDSDTASAVAEGEQCNINNAVILIVSETMIPSLQAFVDGLDKMAGFFSVMEQEIESFRGKGDKSVKNPKKLHYRMMKKKAIEIKKGCISFFAMIPAVRTDFQCIPEDPADRNYVEKWLQQRKEEIERQHGKAITQPLRKMIKSLFTWNAAEQHLMVAK